MKYYYDQLNKKAQLRARLDYFDKYKETEHMSEYLFRSMFMADGEVYE